MRLFRKSGLLTLTFFFVACGARAQGTDPCEAFLKNPVFTSTTLNMSGSRKDAFRRLQCSAEWKSFAEAQAAGVDASVPIFDMPVPLQASWSQEKIDQWKSQNCSKEEREADYNIQLFQSVKVINPISATSALKCREVESNAKFGKTAVNCGITENQSAIIFEASWRRTYGESGPAPTITSLRISSACEHTEAMKEGSLIPEGGVSIMCPSTEESIAFLLNTSRGHCTASSAPKLPSVQIPQNLIATGPQYITGDKIVIQPDTKIVTNGYPLTIRANKVLSIGSNSQIVSFVASPPAAQQAGRYAGQIAIMATDVQGGGLTINNAGEAGGPGITGSRGAPGLGGGPGVTRQAIFKSDCGVFNVICRSIFSTCDGGESGGDGGQGGAGYTGNPGAPGGGAGAVTLTIPSEQVDAIKVLMDVDLSGQPQECGGLICGGVGGPGGAGGEGGDGGPGGPGAPPSTWCGGTDNGAQGAKGPPGPAGPQGQTGPAAIVTLQ